MDHQFVSLMVIAILIAIAIIVTIFRYELDRVRFSFFKVNPLVELEAFLPELGLELRDRLASVQFLMAHTWRNDGVKAIVPFFAVVSPWSDKLGKLQDIHRRLFHSNCRDEQISKIIVGLNELCAYLDDVARSCYSGGMNRSWKGEEVTEDKIFLGEVFGYSRPVWFWKKHRDDPKSYFLPGVQEMSSYDVVSVEARDFINAHATKIIKAVDNLEAACQGRHPARKSILRFN